MYCDEKMDWLVEYLVKYRVRTFLPMQPEVTCSGPEKLAGVRLKELMMKKANETLVEAGFANPRGDAGAFLGNLIPARIPGLGNGLSGVPILGAITQAIPSLRNVPGIGPINGVNPKLDNAIEQVGTPNIFHYSFAVRRSACSFRDRGTTGGLGSRAIDRIDSESRGECARIR